MNVGSVNVHLGGHVVTTENWSFNTSLLKHTLHLRLSYFNNNNNNNKQQLGCHPVAVVILHVHKT